MGRGVFIVPPHDTGELEKPLTLELFEELQGNFNARENEVRRVLAAGSDGWNRKRDFSGENPTRLDPTRDRKLRISTQMEKTWDSGLATGAGHSSRSSAPSRNEEADVGRTDPATDPRSQFALERRQNEHAGPGTDGSGDF